MFKQEIEELHEELRFAPCDFEISLWRVGQHIDGSFFFSFNDSNHKMAYRSRERQVVELKTMLAKKEEAHLREAGRMQKQLEKSQKEAYTYSMKYKQARDKCQAEERRLKELQVRHMMSNKKMCLDGIHSLLTSSLIDSATIAGLLHRYGFRS